MFLDPQEIPVRARALGLWARCWQLAGGRWPPSSRGVTHQIVMMVMRFLQEASYGRLTDEEALWLARETISRLTQRPLDQESDQAWAVDQLVDAILRAELGEIW